MTSLGPSASARDDARKFGVHVRWRSAGMVLLVVVGEVDLLTAPSVLEAATDELDAGCRALVLDLAGVSVCSARCIGVFAEIRAVARRRGVGVRVAHPSPVVRWLADLTRSRSIVDDPTPSDRWG